MKTAKNHSFVVQTTIVGSHAKVNLVAVAQILLDTARKGKAHAVLMMSVRAH